MHSSFFWDAQFSKNDIVFLIKSAKIEDPAPYTYWIYYMYLYKINVKYNFIYLLE